MNLLTFDPITEKHTDLLMALKILHTADWHLGHNFFGYDREQEHDAFLTWLIELILEKEIDLLLISGDIFDVANPSATAQRRFYDFLKQATMRCPGLQIIITAGNHDSAVRLEAPVPLLEQMNVSVIGIIKRTLSGEIDWDSLVIPLIDSQGNQQGWCMAVPYLRQGDYPPPSEEEKDSYVTGLYRMYHQLYEYTGSKRKPGEAIVAMGHLYATGAELSPDDRSERVIAGGLESVAADTFPEGIAYTALGHIHKTQKVGGKENIRYAGSPLPMSFSEINYKHQVILVHIENAEAVSIEGIPVPRTVDLIKLPATPEIPDKVLEVLYALPDREGDDLSYPYLCVQVLLNEPHPGFRQQVEQLLETKAVRLASIVTSYPVCSGQGEELSVSGEELQQIDPLVILDKAFAAKYGEALPEEMKELFQEVLQEVHI